jgi:hypothetical protein
MQNPPKPTIATCLRRSGRCLVIFVGVLHSPHRRCAFRIASTALVYSQCHAVSLYPLRERRERVEIGSVSPAMQSGAWASTLTGHMLLPRARQPEFRLPCRGSAGIPPRCLRREEAVPGEVPEGGPGVRAGPASERPAIVCERESPGTPPDGPGSGSALRPAACTPVTFTRPATHRPAKTHSGASRNTLTSANTPAAAHRTDGAAAG